MKKIIGLFIFIFILLVIFFNYNFSRDLKVREVTYEILGDKIVATLMIDYHGDEVSCISPSYQVTTKKKWCTILISNINTTIKISDKYDSIFYTLTPNINEVVDMDLEVSKIYLAIGEQEEIRPTLNTVGTPNEEIKLEANDNNILSITGNVITGENVGSTTIKVSVGGISETIEVEVTDLITKETWIKKRPYYPCGIYTEEQNKYLDKLLEYKINKAGYQTRAGVIAAMRFLTLQMPYQLNYFFENGRLNNNTGGNYVDGEGRFYHKGLYLNTYKYNELVKIKYGPAIWGCPLVNWEDQDGFKPGVRYPNGLDCSGFITWTFYNGGFDVSDTGAGDNPWTDDDLSDLGPHTPLTYDVLNNGSLKAGDIIASDGHIALVGGIDYENNDIYVAESTTANGVEMAKYSFDEAIATDTLTYVIYLDDYYNQNGYGDGNYTVYWN